MSIVGIVSSVFCTIFLRVTLPTQEQPTTTNIDTGAIAHNILRISNRGAKATPMTMQQLIVITLRKMVQNTELTMLWVCSDVVNDVFIVIEEQVPVFAIHHDF
jgi:hypothetical protein